MSNHASNKSGTTLGRVSYTVITLYLCALVSFALGVAPALAALDQRVSRGEPLDAKFVLIISASVLAGFAVGGFLLGFATIVRCQVNLARRHAESLQADSDEPLADWNDRAQQPSRKPGDASLDGAMRDALRQVQTHLREVRDLTVVGSDERDSVHVRIRENLQRHAAEEVIESVNRRQLGRARVLLQDAEATYGQSPTFERLSVKIEEADRRAEPLDFARTKRLVEVSMNGERWAEAEQRVQELCLNHPESARCRQLWDDTRRARLFAHVERCTVEHHWSEASAAAEEYLERFPDSIEAKSLRIQLVTIKENAEIVQRRQIEARLTELVGGQHYEEALRLARHVVDVFPDSPQAEALREQLPRLEKRVAT